MRQKAGRITAAGMTKEVTFEPVDGPINDRVDDAYRAKYRDSPYLDPMINERLVPRQSKSCHARARADHGRDEQNTRIRPLHFVLGWAMPHGHAVSGANNTMTKGIDGIED